MTEMYAFIAVFAAQILLLSILGPRALVAPLRGQIDAFIALRQPDVGRASLAQLDRKLKLYRWMSWVAAIIGAALLAAIIRYMQRPDWTDGPLEAIVPAYWILQLLPMLLAILAVTRFHELLKRALPPEKRKALLQRRGLFDFVPRSVIALAVLMYFLFIGLLVYIEKHPFPGFAGLLTNAIGITLLYAVMASAIFMTLRRMGSSPLQARDQRLRSVGLAVRVCVYTCILCVASLALNMTLVLLDEQRLEPTFGSISLILIALLAGVALKSQVSLRHPTGAASLD